MPPPPSFLLLLGFPSRFGLHSALGRFHPLETLPRSLFSSLFLATRPPLRLLSLFIYSCNSSNPHFWWFFVVLCFFCAAANFFRLYFRRFRPIHPLPTFTPLSLALGMPPQFGPCPHVSIPSPPLPLLTFSHSCRETLALKKSLIRHVPGLFVQGAGYLNSCQKRNPALGCRVESGATNFSSPVSSSPGWYVWFGVTSAPPVPGNVRPTSVPA